MFQFKKAIVLTPHPNFKNALSDHSSTPHQEVDFQKLLSQHQNYCSTLEKAGIKVIKLDPVENFPDSPFVEDTHLILPEMVFVLNSGAPSRRGEAKFITEALPMDRPHFAISDSTIDGGDVLVVDKIIFIGISSRTEEKSVHFIAEKTKDIYNVVSVKLPAGLHLKSSVTALTNNLFVATQEVANLNIFQNFGEIIVTKPEEKLGANVLPVNDSILIPPHHPHLKEKILEKIATHPGLKGKKLIEVDTSEFNKKDGALTCIGLRFN